MSDQESNYSNIESLMEEVEKFCKSKELREKISQIYPIMYENNELSSHVFISFMLILDVTDYFCGEDYTRELPLHFHLKRGCNIDLDTIKKIVESYPQALTVYYNRWCLGRLNPRSHQCIHFFTIQPFTLMILVILKIHPLMILLVLSNILPTLELVVTG
mmetsp:Transcript_35214/g.57417  ORF Transcript_35214/g.57417 Transcript_35214/m.57417 type:complete len:160 (+) Transcript_35214:321-800(+)